jgi:hypothetical protein
MKYETSNIRDNENYSLKELNIFEWLSDSKKVEIGWIDIWLMFINRTDELRNQYANRYSE